MRNIIIFSNNKSMCSQITSYLREAGYSHIYLVSDCLEGFSMIYRLNPKLIIIDMELPADEILRLKKMISGPLASITLFIAPHTYTDVGILSMIKRGYSHFIIHPIDKPLFLQAVQEIIN